MTNALRIPNGLTSDDLKMFRKLGVGPDLLKDAVRRVTDGEARREFGFRQKKNLDGLAFLYYDLDTLRNGRRLAYVRIRRDHYDPQLEEDPKYLGQSRKTAERQFFCVPTVAELLADPEVVIVLVESEKAALALTAWAKRTGTPLVALAMGGDYGWRRKENGRSRVMPDLAMARDGRQVYILLDANQNTSVETAERRLYQQLRKQGACVHVVKLPDGKWNGPDDYLAANGDAPLGQLFHAANVTADDWRYELLTSVNGAPLAILANALLALRRAPEWAGVLAWDTFACRLVIRRSPPWGDEIDMPWGDRMAGLTAEWLQQSGINVGTPIAVEAATIVAQEHGYHPVQEYLNSLTWDRTARLDNWLTEYMGAENTELNVAVGRCWMISAVARVFDPGCKVDHVLTLLGDQGIYKSTAFGALAVREEWFTDHISDLSSKDSRMELLGKWIVEFGDLIGLRGRDWERVKGFITTASDKFRAPYGRVVQEYKRQCVFGASTNQTTPLADETGNRRFWPVHCTGKLDIANLKADRDQLWAEAVVRYRADENWWLEKEKVITAAQVAQDALYQTGAWDEKILTWLDEGKVGDDEYRLSLWNTKLESTRDAVTVSDVLEHCIGLELKFWKQCDKNSVVRCLMHAGWKLQRATSGARKKFYVRPGKPPLAEVNAATSGPSGVVPVGRTGLTHRKRRNVRSVPV